MEHFQLFLQELRDNDPSLQRLYIRNYIFLQQINLNNEDGITTFAEALKTNTTLQQLNLADNRIDEKGATQLAEALKGNNSIQKLDLGENDLADNGTKQLAEALKTNNSLQELDLYNNIIGNEGATYLAEALKINISLQRLYLDDNWIDDKGIWNEIYHLLSINREPHKYQEEYDHKLLRRINYLKIKWKPTQKIHLMYPESFRQQVQDIIVLFSFYPQLLLFPIEVWMDDIIPYLALLYQAEV